MTTDPDPDPASPVTPSLDDAREQIERARKEVVHLCMHDKKWTMSIPVQDTDSDCVIIKALLYGAALADALQASRAEVVQAQKDLEQQHADADAALRQRDMARAERLDLRNQLEQAQWSLAASRAECERLKTGRCHICGYHPGTVTCSAAHLGPHCLTVKESQAQSTIAELETTFNHMRRDMQRLREEREQAEQAEKREAALIEFYAAIAAARAGGVRKVKLPPRCCIGGEVGTKIGNGVMIADDVLAALREANLEWEE